MSTNLTSGYNVDKINIEAGINMLKDLGYTDERTIVVINYCLLRWSKGEELRAQMMATDEDFYGIDLTSWLRVLSAAIKEAN